MQSSHVWGAIAGHFGPLRLSWTFGYGWKVSLLSPSLSKLATGTSPHTLHYKQYRSVGKCTRIGHRKPYPAWNTFLCGESLRTQSLGLSGSRFSISMNSRITPQPEQKVTSKDLTKSLLTKHFGDPQDCNLKTAMFVVGGCRNNSFVHECSMDHECLHLLSKGQVGWMVQGLVDQLSVSVPNPLQNEG